MGKREYFVRMHGINGKSIMHPTLVWVLDGVPRTLSRVKG